MTSSKGAKAALHAQIETPRSLTVSQFLSVYIDKCEEKKTGRRHVKPREKKEQKEDTEEEEKARGLNFKARRRK